MNRMVTPSTNVVLDRDPFTREAVVFTIDVAVPAAKGWQSMSAIADALGALERKPRIKALRFRRGGVEVECFLTSFRSQGFSWAEADAQGREERLRFWNDVTTAVCAVMGVETVVERTANASAFDGTLRSSLWRDRLTDEMAGF